MFELLWKWIRKIILALYKAPFIRYLFSSSSSRQGSVGNLARRHMTSSCNATALPFCRCCIYLFALNVYTEQSRCFKSTKKTIRSWNWYHDRKLRMSLQRLFALSNEYKAVVEHYLVKIYSDRHRLDVTKLNAILDRLEYRQTRLHLINKEIEIEIKARLLRRQ